MSGDKSGREIAIRAGEELSSIKASVTTTITNETNEGLTDLVSLERSMTMKELVENGRKEANDMGKEIRGEMAAMAKKLTEQNNLQDKARMEEAQKQNNTLEELRFMMMQMMQASAKNNK